MNNETYLIIATTGVVVFLMFLATYYLIKATMACGKWRKLLDEQGERIR